MAIKAITIDFWNTLYNSNNGNARNKQRGAVVLRELRRLGYEVAPEKLDSAIEASWDFFNLVWERDHKTVGAREMVQFYFSHLEVDGDEEAISAVRDVFENGILDHPPALLPGVRESLHTLAERYPLALISDTAFSPGRVLKQLMEQSGISHLFSAFSFSDETGVSKPHPLAFETALHSIDTAPEHCVHIGDIERTDIKGAKNHGMKAILFTGDSNPRLQGGNPAETQADARVADWHTIPELLRAL